jgi:hypothetical protein
MLYGLLNYGVSFNPEIDVPDLSGKVIFITGGVFFSHSLTVLRLCPKRSLSCLPQHQ